MPIDRRSFLVAASTLAAAALLPLPVSGEDQANRTRLILLGTAGGPRPRKTRSGPAQVIVINGTAYVIDCGDGVARQLVLANVPLPNVRHIFLTHHHSDHNADYGNLILLAWISGLQTQVDTWGPPPLSEMTGQFFKMNEFDITTRIADEGRVPLVPLVHAHDLSDGGIILEDENVKVTVVRVPHPPIEIAFAFRFDSKDRSIVISGDTAYSTSLIDLAHGADVLVHEALYPSAIDRLVAPLPNATQLKRSIFAHHTSAEDVGRVAQAANVKTLVLSHFVPAEDPSVTDEMWIDAVRTHYSGQIILGSDLLEL